MSVILAIIVVLIVRGSALSGENSDYMSKESTDGVRGLFVILIFMSHYVEYIRTGPYDQFYLAFRSHMDQAVVIPFLFYSGYGMAIQLEKHGSGYLKKLISRKIPGLFVKFACSVACFLILWLCLGKVYPLKQVLLSFVAWDSIGNSNWYVFGIIGECLIFYISYIFFSLGNGLEKKSAKILGVVFNLLLTLAFIIGLKYMGKTRHWYNTLLMFPLGVVWANLKNKFTLSRKWGWMPALLFSLVIYRISFLHRSSGLKWFTVWCVAFLSVCLLFTVVIRLDGALIRFCARHVFSIYILQRLPMIILTHFGWTKSSPYISFVICACATCLIAIAFDNLSQRVGKKVGGR